MNIADIVGVALQVIGALTVAGFGLLAAWMVVVNVARRSHSDCDHPEAGDED